VGPVKGKEYCVFHDPDITPEQRFEVRSAGGKINRPRPQWISNAQEIGLDFEDMVGLVDEVIRNLRALPDSHQVGAVMLQAVKMLAELHELKNLGGRLADLEEILKERR
jgi:hypothetical protein